MLTIANLVEKTLPVFDSGLKVPEPPVKFKDHIEILEQSNLQRQKAHCIFDMRNWQLQNMGFQPIVLGEAIQMLMGETHTHYKDGEKQNMEWVYNHHKHVIYEDWSSTSEVFYRMEKSGKWYRPPFIKTKKWEVQCGQLDYLKREIPYGVALKIEECKKTNLFNAFCAVAPMEAWYSREELDPIILGEVWVMTQDDEGFYSAGEQQYYFIAKW